jgi:flagellin
MSQVINTNVMSLTAQRNLATSGRDMATALQRLSSGLRINSAKDDAAGLAISQRLSAQVRGLNQATRNASDAISLSQTAEGALDAISQNLQRMRELSVQSANSTNSASDRAALQLEVKQLKAEIDRVAAQTQFNGINLLDGSFMNRAFQVGADANQTIVIDAIDSARTSALGQFRGVVLTAQSIGTADDTADDQSVTVDGVEYDLGSIANDAKALAAAINAKGPPGMLANANATVVDSVTASTNASADGDATITINGVDITVAGLHGNASSNRAAAVAAINGQSAATGVSATDDGSGVKLTAADGRNITLAFDEGDFTDGTLEDFGIDEDGTYGGTLTVSYAAPEGVNGTVSWSGAFEPSDSTIAVSGMAVADVDVSSSTGANSALVSIDAALGAVNNSRAKLGAIQNRFESTISNLRTTAENVAASRSRIQDADFAAETAMLTRAQILQQAGIAILSQANAAPQTVLTLLR